MSRFSRFLPRFLRGDKHQQNDLGDKTVCKVILLDETEFKLPYKGSLRGQYILDKVFEQLNLFEKDYFSVRYIDSTGQTHWLDNLKTLSSQLKGSIIPYTFYFGVKFYAADPCKLREEITRYQFFLQVKQDILHGRLPVSFEEAAELFAFAVQSEIGDYDSQRLMPGYVSEFQFVPNQTEELEDQIAAFHRRLGGTIPATAELKFLDKVKWLDMYGVDLHPVLGEGNTEYFLGLTPTGIVVYKNKTKVGNYFWPRITKVNFKAKVFIIKVKDKINDEHTYAFELNSKAACKHLWKCCVEHQAFFRLNQLGEPQTRAVKQLRSVSKSRSGRQDRQNNAEQQGREQPRVLRVPSRRQARRAMSDPRLNGDVNAGIQYTDGHITLVVTPEQVKGPRHRSLPDLKDRESPRSTRSAPWESNRDNGLYTSGRSSPVSVTQSDNLRYHRNRDSDSESGHRKKWKKKSYRYGYDSDGGHVRKHHHHHRNYWSDSRNSGYDSDPHSERQKYFPSSRKGSDNESDVSFSRRKRREVDSGSESDVSPKYTARQRHAKSGGPDKFEREWQLAMQGMYLQNKENRPNGSIPSVHSAPGGEARQKKTRRRRSKSPNTRRPPEELRQHIEFDLIDTDGFTEEQLKDIPFTNVETKAEPFKVKYSPKTRHRYRSPKRKPPGETDPNGNIKGYMPVDPPPPYSRTPERTPEPVHRTRTPERTSEPKHRISLQPSGHFSDNASVASSMSRSRPSAQRPVTYSQSVSVSQSMPYNKNFNNVISPHNKSPRYNIRSVPQFKENVFNKPSNPSLSPRSLPYTNVFKPIDHNRTDDSGSSLSHTNVNSTPELPNKQNHQNELNAAADGSSDLQGQANVGQGQVQEEEEDRNQDSGLNSSLGNSSYGSGSAVVNTTPRGQGHIYGTQDAIARLYSSPAGTLRSQTGNQGGQMGNQVVQQTGPRNLGHQVVTSEHTAFRNYQSNTFSGQSTYNPQTAQNDRRPNTSYAPSRPGYSYPQTDNSSSNLRHNNQYSDRYSSPQRTSNQPVSSGDRYTNTRQETGLTHYSMPKSMFYNPQTDSQYTDVPPHSRTYNEPQSRNIPSGHSVSQNTPYQNSSSAYSHSTGHSTENSGFMENGSVVQPTWQYVGNGSIPSSAPSQGYTPSSYQQKAPATGNRSPYTRSPGSSPVKNSTVARQQTPEQAHSRSANQSMNNSIPANQSLTNSMTSSPRNYRSPDSAISSLTSMSSNHMSNQSSPQKGTHSYTHSPQKGTSNSTHPSPQKNIPNQLTFTPTKLGDAGYSKERMPAFGRSDIWTEL